MTTWPIKPGWHKVWTVNRTSASTWYIMFVSPEFFSWGWDEEDDPEAITAESVAESSTGLRFEECERPANR